MSGITGNEWDIGKWFDEGFCEWFDEGVCEWFDEGV